MNRIFLNLESIPEAAFADQAELINPALLEIELNQDLSHHLRDVLRLSEGKQLIVVCEKSSKEYLAIVAAAKPKQAVLIKIISVVSNKQANTVVASLICALPKGTHADQICEQVSQFPIDNIVFWQSERSVAKLSADSPKVERWKKIVHSSARQSKASKIPFVGYFEDRNELLLWLDQFDFKQDLLAVCSLSTNAKMLSELTAPAGKVHLVIGPEGDFSPQEEKCFYELGAVPVSLGDRVLRVETAALAAVSACSIMWAKSKTLS